MYYYSPSDEPPTERILLIQAGRSHHSPEYGHITAKVIRRAYADGDASSRYYDGANAKGYRHASWHNNTKGAMFVEDLQVHAQFDIGDRGISGQREEGRGTAPPYGEDIIFADATRIGKREAEQMHKTFQKLDKKLDDQEGAYGRVEDVTDLILRFANALGIRTFAQFKLGNTSLDAKLDEFSAQYVADKVREMVKHTRFQYD